MIVRLGQSCDAGGLLPRGSWGTVTVMGGPGEPGFRGLPGEDAAVSGERLGRALDMASRRWWRLAGRRVDLDGDHRWLDAPMCGPGPVGATWLRAEAGSLPPE